MPLTYRQEMDQQLKEWERRHPKPKFLANIMRDSHEHFFEMMRQYTPAEAPVDVIEDAAEDFFDQMEKIRNLL